MKSNCRHASGQALIEFALFLTIIFFIIVGVFDLGRAFYAAIVIENASREGARYATKHPDEYNVDEINNIKQAAMQEANNTGIVITLSNVVVICSDSDGNGCDPGLPVTVTVTYIYHPVLKLILPNNLQLVRTTKMMVP